MKFLYFGDLHERPDAPKNRTDDYRATQNAKIKEIQMLGRKHNVKAFLQPGDFLDAPKYNYDFLSDVVRRWSTVHIQELISMLITGKVTREDVADRLNDYTPILGAVGNHELFGESLASYPKTSLAFLEEIGFMHFPTKEEPFIFTDEESGMTVAVSATSYDIGMDDPERIDDYIVEEKKGDIHIHIVHGYLTNRDLGEMFPHTVLDAIAKKTKADLTISGHDHMGFPLTEVDGKFFVNPGAIPRLKNDKKELKRRPKVLLIEASKENGLTVKNIYLKSAPKGEDVLSRAEIDNKENMNAKMEEIKSIVSKANVKSGSNIKEVIASIADNDEIDEKIKQSAIDLVSDKMDSIQHTVKAYQPYKITKIVMENFQSHVLTELPVSDGLNVFIGTSGAGKSAIMRALSWVYENDGKNPRRFIHRGKDFTKVSLYLSNGVVISRVVQKKASGKNGYEVFNPVSGKVEEYNTKSLPLIQDLLGFTKLDIDADKGVPLNFQRQGEGWFFIGDGFTPSTRAKVIGAVYQTHYVDAVIKDLESETKRLNSIKKEKMATVEEIEKKMTQYEHIATNKKKLKALELKMAQLEELEDKRDILKDKYDTLCHIEKEIKEKEDIVARLSYVDGAQATMIALQSKIFSRNALSDKMKRLEEMKKEAKTVQMNLTKLTHVENAVAKMEKARDLLEERKLEMEKLSRYNEKKLELNTIAEKMDKLEQRLIKISGSELVEEKLNLLNKLVESRNHLVSKMKELREITDNGKTHAMELEKAETVKKNLMKRYEETLGKLGTCPVCKSHIDENKIDHILNHAI
ncbi:metallophosphoesterase [Rossellomorea marisflavi]|uniref:metallophosphoesterase n=1 Tax=Rossellomorea marisflavi TaxID=189381 RepID=UPI003FA014DB